MSSRFLILKLSRILRISLLFPVLMGINEVSADDRRAYQHGVQILQLPDKRRVALWSSSPGQPPRGGQKLKLKNGRKCTYFTHDIYYALLENENPTISPQPLVSLPEAQEPVSAAISANGTIAITFEDGSDSDIDNCEGVIHQRYQLFNSQFDKLSELLTVTVEGGHSGHITAVGNQFVIVYAEGWERESENTYNSTGKDVYLDVINTQGEIIHHNALSVSKYYPRDWWPLAAGSDNVAMLVWQRQSQANHVTQLMYAIYDPRGNVFVKEVTLLESDLYRYEYDVQYVANINRFVVSGNYLGEVQLPVGGTRVTAPSPKAFVMTLDEAGNIVKRWEAHDCCQRGSSGYFSHVFVRESQPAILERDNRAWLAYPVKPRGVLLFTITQDNISPGAYFNTREYWFPLGTDGVFLDDHKAYFLNLTPSGITPVRIKENSN